MPRIDTKSKKFAQDSKETNNVLGRVDAHFLLILTFLLMSFQKEDINQNKIDSKVEGMLGDLEEDVSRSVYLAIEVTVINSIAGGMFNVVRGWSDEQLNERLDQGPPLTSQKYETAMYQMAQERASGKFTSNIAKDLVVRNGLQTAQSRRLFEDTYQDLLLATRNTSSKLKGVIRDISMEVLQVEGLLAQNNKAMAETLLKRLTEDEIYNRLTKEGLLGIVDAGGKRWRLDSYTKMVVNTKITDAHLQSAKATGLQIGADLAVISYNESTTDACLSWEGVVVSLNGLTPGYPLLDDAIATNEVFHPNCRHHISVIQNISDLTDKQQREHERKIGRVKNPELRPYVRKEG